MEPEPVLQIGTQDGPDETSFASVIAVLRTRADSWVIVDQQTPAVRMFSASGEYLRTIGTKGDGPGEYRKPSWVVENDRGELVVYDSYAEAVGRVLHYDTLGTVLTSETHWHSSDASPGTPLQLLSDGSILFTGSVRATYRRETGQGTVHGTDGVVRWRGGDSSRTIVRVPGQVLTRERLAWTGGGLVTASDSFIYAARHDRYAIAVFSLDGTPRDSIIREDLSVQPSNAAVQQWLQTLKEMALDELGANAAPEQRAQIDSAYAALVIPPTFPMLDGMRTDTQRRLWVRRFFVPDSSSRVRQWSVYSPSGEHLANFQQRDTRFTFRRIEDDHIIGVWRDEDDVPFVRVHRLIKQP